MAESPAAIVIKRACPEHLCRMYEELRIEERLASGELTYVQEREKPKRQPKEDQKGRMCTHNVFGVILDLSLPEEEGIVAKVHYQRTSTGEIGYQRQT